MPDELYNELLNKGLIKVPDEDSELAGYYLVNNSLTANRRVQISTSAVSAYTGLVSQNPTIGFSGDTMTVCLSPNTVYSGVVGWAKSSTDADLLKWGGDNAQSGVECILVDMKAASSRRRYGK